MAPTMQAAKRFAGGVVRRAAVQPEVISKRPARREVINQICEETGVSEREAGSWLDWVNSIVGNLRLKREPTHYMKTREMERRHTIMETIMPDGAVAAPGSAHELVQGFVLRPGDGELALTHSREEKFSYTYCTVTVGVMTVTTT